MAATFDSDEKALTGTTPVDFVPDPGASNQSEALTCNVWNRDNTTRTIKAQKTGGTVTPLELGTVTLAAGARGIIPIAGVVVKNGQKIQLVSDATAATTEPAAHVSWFKIP